MEGTEHIRQDRVTQRLHECGQLLGIELLDQIILGDNRFVSLKERGVFSKSEVCPRGLSVTSYRNRHSHRLQTAEA